MRLLRFILCTLVLLAAGAVAIPGVAGAGVAGVSPGACLGASHHKSVPAGSTVTIDGGWGELSLGLEWYFLHVQTTTLTINGAVVDVSSLYGPIQTVATQYGPGYFSSYAYPTGITLVNPGDSFVFTETISVDSYYPIVGVPPFRASFHRFAVPGEAISDILCVVTAT